MVMSRRPSLELSPQWFATMFRALWKGLVWRQHEFGTLNSERALQGHLVGALSVFAPELVTLVEPTIVPGVGIKPDLWIGLPEQAKAKSRSRRAEVRAAPLSGMGRRTSLASRRSSRRKARPTTPTP